MDFDRNAVTNYEFIDSLSELDNASHVLVADGATRDAYPSSRRT